MHGGCPVQNMQLKLDEVKFHLCSDTVIFGVWWKSSTQLQPEFDEVEFHCSNATVKFGGVEFQLRFNMTEFVRTLFRCDFEGLPICNYRCKTKKTIQNHTKNKHGCAESRENKA